MLCTLSSCFQFCSPLSASSRDVANRRLGTLQRRCDTLFVKDAWKGAGAGDANVSRQVPLGWQTYCEHLWNAPKGELKKKIGDVKLRIRHGDLLDNITDAKAVVNSANRFLAGPARPEYWMFASYAGTSVDETLHGADSELGTRCADLPAKDGVRCPIGKTVTTQSSKLPPIIHAVAPGWHSTSVSKPLLLQTWSSVFIAAADIDGDGVVVAPALGCGTNRTPFTDAAQCCYEACAFAPELELRLVLNSFEVWMEWAGALHFVENTKPGS